MKLERSENGIEAKRKCLSTLGPDGLFGPVEKIRKVFFYF
jgi:hypothetical protein